MARYQYETSPRKLEPEYEPKKKKRQKVNVQKNDQIKKQEEQKKQENLQRKRRQRIVLLLLATFAVLFVISYRNSLINENFAKVKSLKEELALVEKENEQLKVNIESSTNLQNVEQAAKDQLGMQKLTNDQKVYISLPKQDFVEPGTEDVTKQSGENWFQKILEEIKNIWG